MIIIIPSRREISLDYLQPALAAGARVIVVDDTPGTISVDHPQVEVYNWADKERIAGDWLPAFPGLNGACMSFGFYLAWRDADDDELILTLGDDCRLDLPDFPERMEWALSPRSAPVAESKGRFINYVELLEGHQPHMFTRGFPYSDRMEHRPFEIGAAVDVAPAFNLGMARNIQDLNAIDKIHNPQVTIDSADMRARSVLIPKGKLLSVSSGMMQFKRRLIPAVYQLPMHLEVMPEWVVSRFGDIWGGFILKRLMDVAGDDFTIGDPWIHHVLPGDERLNIWKEHVGIMVNEAFIDLLDTCVADVPHGRYEDMLSDLVDAFARHRDSAPVMLKPYLVHLDKAWRCWLAALNSVSR